MIRCLVFIFILCGALISCGDRKSQAYESAKEGLTDTMVVRMYKLAVEGHYEQYINAMASCKNATANYRKQIELSLKQHQAEIIKSKQGVAKVEFVRATFHDNNQMANAFLNVTYKDNTVEEVLFPLVKENGEWKIQ